MVARELHGWDVSPAEAQAIQRKLAGQVSRRSELGHVALVAGADVHFLGKDVARGAVVLLSYPELVLLESQVVKQAVTFPYIPGLLSFRESPVIMSAFHRLSARPDLLLVDGQGIAHPRRMGIASHLGLLLDIPTVGCAKSRLWGVHGPVGEEAGAWVDLVDGDEVVGCVLRTKATTNPLYISIGHKVDLSTARYWVMACCRGYRLPEPTRLAHQAAGGQLRSTPSRLGEEAEQGRLL